MQTMNQALYNHYQRRLITLEEAMAYSSDTDELRAMLDGRGKR
jgi:twitching motility protein PilT